MALKRPKSIEPNDQVAASPRPKQRSIPIQTLTSNTEGDKNSRNHLERRTNRGNKEHLPPQTILRSYPLSISTVAAHAPE
jgi:hypothetical protein